MCLLNTTFDTGSKLKLLQSRLNSMSKKALVDITNLPTNDFFKDYIYMALRATRFEAFSSKVLYTSLEKRP